MIESADRADMDVVVRDRGFEQLREFADVAADRDLQHRDLAAVGGEREDRRLARRQRRDVDAPRASARSRWRPSARRRRFRGVLGQVDDHRAADAELQALGHAALDRDGGSRRRDRRRRGRRPSPPRRASRAPRARRPSLGHAASREPLLKLRFMDCRPLIGRPAARRRSARSSAAAVVPSRSPTVSVPRRCRPGCAAPDADWTAGHVLASTISSA